METNGRNIMKIAREANKLVIRTLKEDGIGSGEMDLIHLIRHKPGISQKEIAEALHMDKGAVARRTARLEQKGYLTRRTNPDDGRSQFLYATAEAERLKRSKTFVETVFFTWLLEELSEEEQAVFSSLLERLYRRAKQESRQGFAQVAARLEEDGHAEN